MISMQIMDIRQKAVALLTERRQAVLAAAAGLGVLIVLGMAWLVFDWLMTPSTPDLATASPQKVARFVADERGMLKMRFGPRKEFLHRLRQEYSSPAKRRELAGILEDMAPSERRIVREATFAATKDQFVEDAFEYLKTKDKKKREQLLERNARRGADLRDWLVGPPGGPDLTYRMDEGMPARLENIAKYIVTHTKPAERAVVQPYAEDMDDYLKELKQQEEVG